MKKLIVLIICAFVINGQAISNPYMPESLIYEIYFDDDDNWYLAVDVYFMEFLGIQTFQEIGLYSSSGAFVFKDDFLPDFNTYETIITEEALVYPHELYRNQDYIHTYWSQSWFLFMDLSWENSVTAPVNAPLPGQSLMVTMVYEDEYFNPEFWLVKRSAPGFLGYNGLKTGEFEGFLFDQNEMPVANAQIKYVPDWMTNPPNFFPPLITNEEGYFYDNYLWARNYHLHGIVIDGVNYDFDKYVSIEPDSVNTCFLQMVLTGINSEPPDTRPKISNYPNPFADATTFILHTSGNGNLQSPVMKIMGVMGQVVSNQSVTISGNENNFVKFTWKNTENLPSGIYSYLLIDKGLTVATGKMLIQ